MPRIPQAEQSIGATRLPDAFSRQQATPGMFLSPGADIAQAVGKIAQTALPIVADIENDFSKAQARETLASSSKELMTLTEGFKQRKGNQVKTLVEDVEKESQRIFEEGKKKLANDSYALALYEANFADENKRAVLELTKYRNQEIEQYNKDSLLAHNLVFSDKVIADRSDNVSVKEHIAAIRANTEQYFADQDDNFRQAKSQEAADAAIIGGLQAAMEDDPVAGKAFFEEHKDMLSAKAKSKYQGAINEAAAKAENLKQADDIFLKFQGDMAGAQNAINKIEDPEKRKFLMSTVQDRFKQEEDARNYQDKKVFEAASDEMKRAIDSGTIKNWKVPYWRLSDSQARALDEQKRKAIDEANGIGVKTDLSLYNNLMKMPEDKFKSADLTQYAGKLSTPDFMRLQEFQRKGRDPKVVSESTIVSNSVRGLFPQNDQSLETNLKRNQAIETINRRYQALDPKDRNVKTLNEIIKEETSPVYGGGWRGPKYRFELNFTDDRADAKEIAQNKKAFKDLPPTAVWSDQVNGYVNTIDANTVEVYRAGLPPKRMVKKGTRP